MTKREMLTKIMRVCANDAEIVGFCGHELELLDRKNTNRVNKPTAKQVANASYAEMIYAHMEPNVSYRVSDLQAMVPELADASNQRVTHILTKMRENVLISREVVKGVAYFSKI